MSIRLDPGTPAGELAGRAVRELELPDECLVAAIRREGRTLVPRGNTALLPGDRLLVIGEPKAIEVLARTYGR
ncbi:MAG: TrkA C-terminal domain-containing protein [Planctomycetota bacterium]